MSTYFPVVIEIEDSGAVSGYVAGLPVYAAGDSRPEVEAAIQSNLDQLMAGKTVLAIAHRLSTIRNAERIVVMEQGEIAEEGLHEELLARDGIYARLQRLQLLDSTATEQTVPQAVPSP